MYSRTGRAKMESRCKKLVAGVTDWPEELTHNIPTNDKPPAPCGKRTLVAAQGGKSQVSSFILFASLVIMINLCPFQTDLEWPITIAHHLPQTTATTNNHLTMSGTRLCQDKPTDCSAQEGTLTRPHLSYLESSLDLIKLMFTRPPLRLNRRVTRFTQAEARVLGKMAKVWYIKKKIKKLSKKLKKHTIAVPVFTAIPIYEHSYYPQPHVTHVSHHGGMHHAAASSYAPATVAQVAASSAVPITAATVPAHHHQQMTTSASNQHQVAAYRMAPHHRSHTGGGGGGGGGGGLYHSPMAAAQHIINAYAPSPPLFVDETGGLYGHYGNAYGRYDGGYHFW